MNQSHIDDAPVDDPLGSMASGYSIKVASRMTGLSVDTLRMWERRYDFPSPMRNRTGNRLYGEADVERLVLIARAMKFGYRAGEAIRLTNQELTQVLAVRPVARGASSADGSTQLEHLLDLVRSNEVGRLRDELRRIPGVIGAQQFVGEVAGPLLEAIGHGWADGTLAIHQEHLASVALSTELRLLAALHAHSTGPKLMLATLPREQHTLGLELAALMALLAGASVETIGPDLPVAELARAAVALRVQAVGLSISLATAPAAVTSHLVWLAEHLPTPIGIWLGGKGATSLQDLPNRVKVLGDWSEFEDAIAALARGR